ncbi:hypothetical protein CWE13_12065 [Aliidiomarina shirensis]|uniref:RDD domain-containing protein n=1 Tax=Aliidiomarina shirensis TaxID=1048642 RepID=A0A432WKL7_9GAMM|nr:RDD family protein [Aliidiomarina shirensis]RUO34356.1 hypothetical protein CWE13_12065 [Aliidiomarina shirensis]
MVNSPSSSAQNSANTETENLEYVPVPRAGFGRRILAIVYDSLVVAAVIMFAFAVLLAALGIFTKTGVINLADGEDHAALLQGNPLTTVYLISVLLWFYVGFWVRGGQTLGMRTWRLRVRNTDNSRITKKQALIRAVTALFGLGNIWVLFGSEKLALQDRIAKCEVVVLSKEANQFVNWK